MTNYTLSGRLAQPTPGDPAVKNLWGGLLNENDALLEAMILGTTTVAVGGLTSYTLTTANGASDQARCFQQVYTGSLPFSCTVTLPNVPKIGWAKNSTTGGGSVILTCGPGTTATIPPDGNNYWYQADGVGNVVLIGPASGPSITGSSSNQWNVADATQPHNAVALEQVQGLAPMVTHVRPSSQSNMISGSISFVAPSSGSIMLFVDANWGTGNAYIAIPPTQVTSSIYGTTALNTTGGFFVTDLYSHSYNAGQSDTLTVLVTWEGPGYSSLALRAFFLPLAP